MNLDTPISFVKGVGPKLSEKFASVSINTVRDLIYYFPRIHEDFSRPESIAKIRPGNVVIKAKVESIETRRTRKGMSMTSATLYDETGKIQAIWFNQHYREAQLKTNDEFYFIGEYSFSFNRYQLLNPRAEKVSDLEASSHEVVSIYRQVKFLKSQTIRKILGSLRPFISNIPESMPEDIIKRQNLMSIADALENIHFPSDIGKLDKANHRLAFDELFQLLLASQLNKKANSSLVGYEINFDQKLIKNFVDNLPYKLTNAQRLATWDILQDLEKSTPMNRMLQGDVGSGKTLVAGIAMLQAAKNGYQSVIVAPTEILAVQHAETLSKLLESNGVRVGLLTGKVKGKKRELIYEAIKNGEIDIVVGTHAVFQDKVQYKQLGLVVIDEQHRFGVNQRQALVTKSKLMPHLLSMTATPIPRSLALTLYGEMEISILNEKPVGRLPIITKLCSDTRRNGLYKEIDSQISAGRQAYVICSLIDDNKDNDLKSVEQEYKKLKSSVFKHLSIGLLHGKLSSEEKNQVMEDFKSGKYQILVSTTVVEVGVDVPNATIMLIEDSERFGLSQLHQLRGRVGRSSLQSYCYLMYAAKSKPSVRLQEIEKSNDGFYLAEVDLKLRGPGEIYGKMQHGALNLQIATLSDYKLIAECSKEAKYFVEKGYELIQYSELERQVNYYQRLTTLN
jgi:ATP-dependent DNA helicase RecG